MIPLVNGHASRMQLGQARPVLGEVWGWHRPPSLLRYQRRHLFHGGR